MLLHARLRREELSEVVVCVRAVCVGCALFVCVSYLLCHVQVLPSGTRRPVVVVGRQGRFGNETKRLRESQRAMIRHD